MIVKLQYHGHDVVIKGPDKYLTGKHTITIGTLVKAYPIVQVNKVNNRIRVIWDRDYGKRFNKLLQGAFTRFLIEKVSV